MAKSKQKKWRHTVKELPQKAGIVQYAAHAFSVLGSKSAVKKAITGGRLYLNGKKAGYRDKLKKGDLLELDGAGIREVKKLDLDLDIVYEDDFLLVVNKPGGIAVNGNRNKTVENALSGFNKNNTVVDALPRPIAVHRIDVPTNGLVLLAKSKTALIQLSKAFQENRIQKEYIALVHGKTDSKGRINNPVGGKPATTVFETLEILPSHFFFFISLLKLKPITGRTHQLRIHLNNKGHLIVGDKQYAKGEKTILGKGLMLCARRLQFEHPVTGKKLDLYIDPPAKFGRILKREEERFHN